MWKNYNIKMIQNHAENFIDNKYFNRLLTKLFFCTVVFNVHAYFVLNFSQKHIESFEKVTLKCTLPVWFATYKNYEVYNFWSIITSQKRLKQAKWKHTSLKIKNVWLT